MNSQFDVELLRRHLRSVAAETPPFSCEPPTQYSLKHLAEKYLNTLKEDRKLSSFSVACDETPRQQAKRNTKARSRRHFVADRAMRRHPDKSRRYRMWKRVADKHFDGIRLTVSVTPLVPIEYFNLTFDIVSKP